MFECVHACVIVIVCVCVWAGLYGCPGAFYYFFLNCPASCHPNPFSVISPTIQTATRENTGIKPISQGLTMNVLKVTDSPLWWCFNYTTSLSVVVLLKATYVNHTCLPASCVPAPHICTVFNLHCCKLYPVLGLIQ